MPALHVAHVSRSNMKLDAVTSRPSVGLGAVVSRPNMGVGRGRVQVVLAERHVSPNGRCPHVEAQSWLTSRARASQPQRNVVWISIREGQPKCQMSSRGCAGLADTQGSPTKTWSDHFLPNHLFNVKCIIVKKNNPNPPPLPLQLFVTRAELSLHCSNLQCFEFR